MNMPLEVTHITVPVIGPATLSNIATSLKAYANHLYSSDSTTQAEGAAGMPDATKTKRTRKSKIEEPTFSLDDNDEKKMDNTPEEELIKDKRVLSLKDDVIPAFQAYVTRMIEKRGMSRTDAMQAAGRVLKKYKAGSVQSLNADFYEDILVELKK